MPAKSRESKHQRKSKVIPPEDVYLAVPTRDARRLRRLASNKPDSLKQLIDEQIDKLGKEEVAQRQLTNDDASALAAVEDAKDWWTNARHKVTELNPVTSLCDAIEMLHLDETLREKAEAEQAERSKNVLLRYQDKLEHESRRLFKLAQLMQSEIDAIDKNIVAINKRLEGHLGGDLYLDKLWDCEKKGECSDI